MFFKVNGFPDFPKNETAFLKGCGHRKGNATCLLRQRWRIVSKPENLYTKH